MSGEVGRAEEAGQVLKGCLPFRLNIGLKILYLFCSSEKFSRAINVYPVEESPRDPEKGRVQIFRLNSKLDQQIASLDTTRSFSATTFNFKFSNFSDTKLQAAPPPRLHKQESAQSGLPARESLHRMQGPSLVCYEFSPAQTRNHLFSFKIRISLS